MRNAIPWHSVELSKQTFKTIRDLFHAKQIFAGPHTNEFEKRFAEYIGTKHALFVSSARAGLYFILKALKLNYGDEIILPSFNFLGIPAVIKSCGLKPVFVDVDVNTYNIDVSRLRESINSRTKAVIATHMFGLPCEIESIMETAGKHDLIVIEDCAHACGAEYRGRKTGSFGHAAIFSFAAGKDPTTFQGGMVVCRSERLFDGIKKTTLACRKQKPLFFWPLPADSLIKFYLTRPPIFSFAVYPFLKAMDFFSGRLIEVVLGDKPARFKKICPAKLKIRPCNLQAAIGINQLKGLNRRNKKRRFNSMILTERLRRRGAIRVPRENTGCRGTYLYYMVKLRNQEQRETMRRKLLWAGIAAQNSDYFNCSALKIFSESGKNCPVSEELSRTLLQIPNAACLKREDVLSVADRLNGLCAGLDGEKHGR